MIDGLPTQDLRYGVLSSDSKEVYDNTKNILQEIGNSGTHIISLMKGTSADDEDHGDAQANVELIFGTEANPTTGDFYNIKDTEIEDVVNEKIFQNVMEKSSKSN